MEFGLLGPLVVRTGQVVLPVPRGKQRAILATLLLDANRVVSVDDLAEVLWGSAPPPSARVSIQNYVMRLRKALADGGGQLIGTEPGGYVIHVAPGQVDVTCFEEQVRAARSAAAGGAWDTAAVRARAALVLWRGQPLADVDSEVLAERGTARLAELHLQALEERIDADLHLGQHRAVIAELRQLVAAYPLRERLPGLLMLALYQDGRQAEALAAYQHVRRVLVEELGTEPGIALRELHQRMLLGDAVLNEHPLPGGEGNTSARLAARPGDSASPYLGLCSFHERDADLFFGREAVTSQVLSRMSECLSQPGLLVISGASGAGTTSLLRAGVLPRLRKTGLALAPESAGWPGIAFTPGQAPLDELAVRIAPLAGLDAASVRRSLAADPAGFALIIRQAALVQKLPATGRVLVVVDQLEQLLTLCRDDGQRRAFIEALHAAATSGHGPGQVPPALVVLGVRADFEARFAGYPQLTEAIKDRYLVTSMTSRQLRMVICGPARKAGFSVEDDLVETLVREAGAYGAASPGAGVLPLLSRALDQAWRHRAGKALTLADYERSGGIERAIAESAHRAYDSLKPAQQAAARQVFLRLAAASSAGIDTAQPVGRAELTCGLAEREARDIEAVLEAFTAERVLTLTARTVELSHEVLLSSWPLLNTWLAETRSDRIVGTTLHRTAADWARHSRDPSYLHRGSLLQSAVDVAARAPLAALGPTDRDFLRASLRAGRRRRYMYLSFVAFVAALAVGLGAVSILAIGARRTAARQRDVALSGRLAARSESLVTSDPALARRESLVAFALDHSPQARYAMLNAVTLSAPTAMRARDGRVDSLAFSPDGRLIATGSDDGAVRLWSVATGRVIGVLAKAQGSRTGPVNSLAFAPDGQVLAAGTQWDGVLMWSLATRRRVSTPLGASSRSASNGPSGTVSSVTFSADSSLLAYSGGNGNVWLRNVVTGRLVPGLAADQAFWPAFSAARDTLAYIDDINTVRLWNPRTRRGVRGLRSDASGPWTPSVTFSADGQVLAYFDESGTVRLWNVRTHREIGGPFRTPSGLAAPELARGPNGKVLAYTDDTGTVRLWNLMEHHEISGPESTATGVGSLPLALSPDGNILVTVGTDGLTRLWDVPTHQQIGLPLVGDNGLASAVSISPDGRRLAIGGADGITWLWNLSPLTNVIRVLCASAGSFTPAQPTLRRTCSVP